MEQLIVNGRLSAEASAQLNSIPCFAFMGGVVVSVEDASVLTVEFPIKPEYCNPAGSMQGGLITAAFDNAFGLLSHILHRSLTTTVNINTNYHRPIFPGDTLVIKAHPQNRGRTLTHLRGEAYNQAGKLVASADCHFMALPLLRELKE